MAKKRYVFVLRQLAAALGYLLLYTLVRPLSDAHWQLTAGLRLAVLLLVPYRYWVALVIADTATNAYQSDLYAPQFGLLWAFANALPPIAFAMPVVWWCKERLALFPSKRLVNLQALLFCTLVVPVIWSLLNYGAIVLAKNPGVQVSPVLLVYLFVGAYVALLTTIPWIIIAKLEYRSGTLSKRLRTFATGPLALDTGVILVPALLLLAWLTLHGKEEKQIYCLFMFMPVAWLTLKHGWRAAVLGGTIVVTCISFLMNYETPDPVVLQVQAIIAFAITCLLALGARISAINQKDERERIDATHALHLARQSLRVTEMRLRQASETLEHVCGEIQLTQNRLLHRFRTMLPANESQMYTRQAATTQEKVYQIAEALHPIAWRRRGLPAALRENLGRSLDEIGIAYRYQITGRGFSALSSNLHAMVYRLACEGVVYICANVRCSHIRLTLRGGELRGSRLIVLRVEGTLAATSRDDAFFNEGQRDRVAHKLGATGLSLLELRDHVRLFNGGLHVRTTHEALRITALLQDVSEKEREPFPAPAPLRLWVN